MFHAKDIDHHRGLFIIPFLGNCFVVVFSHDGGCLLEWANGSDHTVAAKKL
jgi:hypothetical protein